MHSAIWILSKPIIWRSTQVCDTRLGAELGAFRRNSNRRLGYRQSIRFGLAPGACQIVTIVRDLTNLA